MALYFEENLEIYVEKLYFMKKEAFLSSISFESIIIRAEVKKTTTSNQTYLGNDSGFMIAGQLAGRFITVGPSKMWLTREFKTETQVSKIRHLVPTLCISKKNVSTIHGTSFEKYQSINLGAV